MIMLLLFSDFEILSGNISDFQILLKYVNFTARQFGKIRSDLSISLLSNKAQDFPESFEPSSNIFLPDFVPWILRESPRLPALHYLFVSFCHKQILQIHEFGPRIHFASPSNWDKIEKNKKMGKSNQDTNKKLKHRNLHRILAIYLLQKHEEFIL